MYRESDLEMRVLILAPIGRDAALLEATLSSAEIDAAVVADAPELLERLREGVGTAILAQEAIGAYLPKIGAFLAGQPAWSDIPLLILTRGGRATYASKKEAEDLRALGNVTLIERPMRPETMQSTVRSALRARMRQYQVRQRERSLQQANSDLEQFAHSASHDLKEPIRGIGLYSELLALRLDGALDEEGSKFLGIIQASAKRMEGLVNALLSYAHTSVDSSDVTEAAVQADAERSLRLALENLSVAIMESEANVTASSLPTVRMREGHLAQLFQNLVGNALKYRERETAPAIQIHAQADGGLWKFSVSDNGIGIPPQYHSTIFGIFKRLHTNSEYSGAGMGLAICQRIVERYGGKIWVESEGRGGSTFVFTVPAA